jgi:hypothetical protein
MGCEAAADGSEGVNVLFEQGVVRVDGSGARLFILSREEPWQSTPKKPT